MRPIGRKIDPNRRMNRQHPFDVWRALVALQLRDRFIGVEDYFYEPTDIARVLYTNFDDLLPRDRQRVIVFKMSCPIRCLRYTCFVEEFKTFCRKFDRWGNDLGSGWEDHNRFRARHVFNIKGISRQQMFDYTYDALDKDWGKYIGRRGPSLIDYDGYPD
jgi:hypothetical protein